MTHSPTALMHAKPMPTMRIVNPQKPGESLIINVDDFDPAVQTAWDAPPVTQTSILSPRTKRGT